MQSLVSMVKEQTVATKLTQIYSLATIALPGKCLNELPQTRFRLTTDVVEE